MSLPKTNTTIGGALGKVEAIADGVSGIVLSGVAVSGKFALGDVLGPFLQLSDAEAVGIDSAYDTTNSTVAWKHIKDFYTEAPVGTKLYVMVVAMTQTLTSTSTAATANGYKKMIDAVDDICLVGLTFTPDNSYTPSYTNQLEADLWTALAQVKITAEAHRAVKKPYRVIVEGRNYQGTPASLKDLRSSGTTPAVNRAMVVIGNDWSYGQGDGSVKAKYASVGAALGRAAAVKVNRNIGRVKNGALVSITTGGLSNGTKIGSVSEANQDSINDFGYVFLRKHVRKSGFYWNDDHMACVSTDTYSQLSLGRTVDKIDKIVHATNVEEILDEIEVDPATGKLDSATAKQYEALLEDAINAQMGGSKKEISGLKCFVDPDQNVISTSALAEVQRVVPTGTLRQINTSIELTKSL
jgi:hypothetical protein